MRRRPPTLHQRAKPAWRPTNQPNGLISQLRPTFRPPKPLYQAALLRTHPDPHPSLHGARQPAPSDSPATPNPLTSPLSSGPPALLPRGSPAHLHRTRRSLPPSADPSFPPAARLRRHPTAARPSMGSFRLRCLLGLPGSQKSRPGGLGRARRGGLGGERRLGGPLFAGWGSGLAERPYATGRRPVAKPRP